MAVSPSLEPSSSLLNDFSDETWPTHLLQSREYEAAPRLSVSDDVFSHLFALSQPLTSLPPHTFCPELDSWSTKVPHDPQIGENLPYLRRLCSGGDDCLSNTDLHQTNEISQENLEKAWPNILSTVEHVENNQPQQQLAFFNVDTSTNLYPEPASNCSQTSMESSQTAEVENSTPKTQHFRQASTFTCSDCHAILPNRRAYNHHLKFHAKPHKCDACNRSFKLSRDLKRHQRTHEIILTGGFQVRTGEYFYCEHGECAFSKKGFLRRDNYLRHMRNQHSQEAFSRSRVTKRDKTDGTFDPR